MERSKPQAFLSSYAPRLRTYNNSLLTPVLPSAPSGPISRTTKRGTTIINYAEDGFDDLDDDSDDTRRRPTGLRSLRKEDSASRQELADKVGKEIKEPVDVQGIWRDWMGKSRSVRSDQQNAAQANLPLTLIPIRIDLDIPSFIPPAPFPAPNPNSVDISLPQYRPQEMTVPYKLRDIFCWNLHETLITTDQFAQTLAQDLDLPNRPAVIAEISKQIRTQLEEYAGVALHPLFHSEPSLPAPAPPAQGGVITAGANGTTSGTPRPSIFKSRDDSPASFARGVSRPDTPVQTGGQATPQPQVSQAPEVTAEATPILPDSDEFNPDDTYRCIINLSLNLSSMLYTDKFEWSLLHPPGTAEAFAKATCADLGLAGEWVPAMTHAIYEAVLRLKKEACEAGGLVGGWGGAQQELPNDAAHGQEAGWRYDPDHLADDWEPKVEFLSKEEMEKREGDRERQIRRLRRETARFSSTTGMLGGTPFGLSVSVEAEEERMGRGERSKKKRRFRSLSPLARGGTPLGRVTPDVGGYGGGVGALTDMERMSWRCSHCRTWGTSVWAVRDGPAGPKIAGCLARPKIFTCKTFERSRNPLMSPVMIREKQRGKKRRKGKTRLHHGINHHHKKNKKPLSSNRDLLLDTRAVSAGDSSPRTANLRCRYARSLRRRCLPACREARER
ncbi:snf5 smarcb1 ini1 [Trichoderma arundinaceum]|uniref:Snf5 smarcb1 ini1 n=1 Tax=Trichoderma arundinaceum TaxID=490622 RepID=A0A395NH04_TRIAR|nr:snf5 smarcb1 ini1 [Trichoderma arundinaceum]